MLFQVKFLVNKAIVERPSFENCKILTYIVVQISIKMILHRYQNMSQLKTNICTVERDSADTSAVPQQIHIARAKKRKRF